MSEATTGDRFQELFDLIGDPVVELELVEQLPVVRAVNPAFEDVFGYESEALVGNSLNEFIVPDDLSGEADQFDRRTSKGKQNTGLVTRETAGGQREFFYRGVPYEQDGTQYGLAIYTDVTEQRRYERHFQVINRLLRHDLRNNLQVVIGAADRIVEGTTDPNITDIGKTIADQSEAIITAGDQTRIIEQVLMNDHEHTAMDVTALCRSIATDIEANRPTAGIAVETGEDVHVDGIKWLDEAITAVIENAVEHGGDDPTIRVSAERRDEHVVVAVADDGPGIPRELRAPVFEDHSISQLQHNKGIGLWLVRWVVEACGGHVEYEEEDGWTVVELWLHPAVPTGEHTAGGP